MLYACAYETAYFGSTPWCQLFDQKEILDFEYELDLLMNYAFVSLLLHSRSAQKS